MKKNTTVLSILYTLFTIIGVSFLIKGNFSLLLKTPIHIILSIIVSIILYYLFKYIINAAVNHLDHFKQNKDKPTNKLIILFDKHPILFSMIFMLICWLPYIIAYYPGILNPDNVFQIRQYFGIDNKYSYYVNLIDPKQIITNHHPYFHTILLGTCVKIGLKLHNANLGFFLFTSIQLITCLFTFSYTIYYLKKNNINHRLRVFILLLYSLVPLFPFYAMTLVKDSLYSCIFVLYVLFLHSLLKEDLTLKKAIQIIIISILLFLLRNNGIHVFILSFPFILINNKKWTKYLIIIFIVFSSYKLYNKVLLPSLKVTPTSIRETLSIPFQQTARYAKYHNTEISKEDKRVINRILNYETIRNNYNPDLSDPVKNTFNKDYTKEDLNNYFKVWKKGLVKHPLTYVEATVGNTYGYFCPIKTNWYLYYKYEDRLYVEDHIEYHYNNQVLLRRIITLFALIFPYIPIIGLIANIGFNTWLVLFIFFYLLGKKRYKEIIVLLPCLISILVCIASPANTYFRYILPIVFTAPFLIFIPLIKENTK